MKTRVWTLSARRKSVGAAVVITLFGLFGIMSSQAQAGELSNAFSEGGVSKLASKLAEQTLDLSKLDAADQAVLRDQKHDTDVANALLKKYRQALEDSPFGVVPKDLIGLIAGLLRTPDLTRLTRTCREMHRGSEAILNQRTMRLADGHRISETSHPHLWKFLNTLVEVGPVTAEEAKDFQERLQKRGLGEETTIQGPVAKFRLSDVVTVGLYREVMTLASRTALGNGGAAVHYPPGVVANNDCKQEWDRDPLFPAIRTTLGEDQAFATALAQLTGRRFKVIAPAEWELALRGRESGAQGPIQATRFSVGKDRDSEEEALAHGWFWENSGRVIRRVGDHPVGSEANGYGVRRGNVSIRDASGSLRGGGFWLLAVHAWASFRFGGCSGNRFGSVGVRLSEDF